MADYALTASVVSRFIGRKCPENGEAAVECWGEFADAVGPALPFLVKKDALRRIPFRELGLPCVELGSMIPQQGEMWVLFCFRDALRDRACADAGIRTDGFALVLEWRKGASDSALLSRAFHALADLVRRQQKVEGWGLHPAYARYGDNVDFTDADLFADDAGRASVASAFGALAAGLYSAVRNKRLSRWPFPTLQWDEKRGRIVGVAGLREKMSVAIDCGAKVITVAKEQRDGAENILGELKASANGLSTESARIGVVAVRTDVKANSVGKAILCAVERSWLILRIILYVVVFLSCGLAVGFFGLFKFLDRGRADLQLAVVQCQTDYDELRHSYRYVPWRTEFFANVSNMIHELNEKLRQPFIGRAEASCAVGRVQVLLKEIESLDEERIKLETTAFDMINPARKDLKRMLDKLPLDFAWSNGTKEVFSACARQLDEVAWNITRTNQVDVAYINSIRRWTENVRTWVGFKYKDSAKILLSKFSWLNSDNEIEAFLCDEILKERKAIESLAEDESRHYYEQIMRAVHLHDAVKFYKSDFAHFLQRIDECRKLVSVIRELDVQCAQVEKIRVKAIDGFKNLIAIRTAYSKLAEFKVDLEGQLTEIEKIYELHVQQTKDARRKCRSAYQARDWVELYGYACLLKSDEGFKCEGEAWEEIAKWGLCNRSCSNVLVSVTKECKTVMVAYEKVDADLLNSAERRKAMESLSMLFGDGKLKRGPDEARMEQVKNTLDKLPLPEIGQYLFAREIYSFLNNESLDDLNWIYEQTSDPDVLVRYIHMFLYGRCGKKKDLKRAQQLLRQLECLGGEAARMAHQYERKLYGL